MKAFAIMIALATLASCDTSEPSVTGPKRQECENLKSKEVFRFRLKDVKTFSNGIEFVDEDGWRRTVTEDDNSDFKCREIPE